MTVFLRTPLEVHEEVQCFALPETVMLRMGNPTLALQGG